MPALAHGGGLDAQQCGIVAWLMRHVLALTGLAQLASCLTEGPPLSFRPVTGDDAGPRISVDMPIVDASFEFGPMDPHALIAVDPSHGPFNGGQARSIRGNGFTMDLRVLFGPHEVPKENV